MNSVSIAKLRERASYYAARAQALFLAIEELEGDDLGKKRGRTTSVLNGAVTMHATEMNGHRSAPLLLGDGRKAKKKKNTGEWTSQRATKRAAIAEFLGLFSTTEPRLPDHPRMQGQARKGLNSLTARGYLKRLPTGEYLRTAKAYRVVDTATAVEPNGDTAEKPGSTKQDRERVQRFLWKFSKTEPREFPIPKGLPSSTMAFLVRHQYLTKTAKGYVRSKNYSTKPEKK